MLCPSRDFKTQEPSIRRIEDAEDLLAILKADSLNVNKSPFYALRSVVRHVLMLKTPNFLGSTICPTRKLVLNTLNDPDEEIFELPVVPIVRFPFPRKPRMPEPNRTIL